MLAQRKSDVTNSGCITICPRCGNYYSDFEALSVSIVLSDIIRKQRELAKAIYVAKPQMKQWKVFQSLYTSSQKTMNAFACEAMLICSCRFIILALRDVNNACSFRPDLLDAFNRKAKILTNYENSTMLSGLEYLRSAVCTKCRSSLSLIWPVRYFFHCILAHTKVESSFFFL